MITGDDKLSKVKEETLKLYSNDDFMKLFSLIRIWDAPFDEINKSLPQNGRILDLGAGDGILTNFLALSNSSRDLIGLEINESRIKEADKRLKNTRFIHTDILKATFPSVNSVLLAHVLHHLPSRDKQVKLLKKCIVALKKGEKLIIVEVSEKPLVKYWYTWLVDTIALPILFGNKVVDRQIFFRKDKQWIKLLKSLGFSVNLIRCHRGKPFSHVIFECKKG